MAGAGTVSPIYRQQTGPVDLDPGIFEFYFLRRAFEDITDFILRILEADGSPERDQEDLVEILDNLAGLAKLPGITAELQGHLESHLR